MSSFRSFGPSNAALPEATGQVIGFMRDPNRMPFLKYSQYIPAPVDGNGLYRYAILDPDDPTRMVNVNEYAWALDDKAPTADAFVARVRWDSGQTFRYAFPYQFGDRSQASWRKQGIDPKNLYDRLRLNHAMLHRASRVVTKLGATSWGANTSTVAAILATMGVPGAFFDQSSGVELLGDGTPNPRFQVIKRVFQAIKRRMHLATNGALTGEEFFCIVPPLVAVAMAVAGEIVNFLKQSPHAKELTNPNLADWSLPESYGGFKLVVEDTVRTFIRQNADGTVADVSVAAQKDYILNTDTIYFASRPGGLDGQMGFPSFSTVQIYTFNGEAAVQARGDSWNELTEGRIVTEDQVQVPSALCGFALTDVLS